ncbi:MAG: phenylalanine--tRNA ligase subunit alpha [Candidatus Aenigmatarchaeota archaeon]
MYKLTAEGEKYLKEGLPEKNLIKKLAQTPLTLHDLKEMAGSQIAVSWAKKNGWLNITGGKLELTELGRKALSMETSVEDGLREVGRVGSASHPVLEVLLSRNLAEEAKERKAFLEKEIAQLTTEIITSRAWERLPFRAYDINAPAPALHPGKKQTYTAFLEDVKRELIAMGFTEMEGPLVELSFFNADALFMPQDHPARGIHDVYFVKEPKYGALNRYEPLLKSVKKAHIEGVAGSRGWGGHFSEKESARLVLRSHGTALSARTLISKPKVPGAYFAVSRVYRPEKLDATHLTEFNQLEGIVLDEDANFKKLLGLMKEFAMKIAGTDKVRFRPAYFPFTEPSVQGMVWHAGLKKWIEIMPAGMFRPELTAPLGVNVPVMAWGFGVDRLFMVKENITDVRDLFTHDLKILRDAKVL